MGAEDRVERDVDSVAADRELCRGMLAIEHESVDVAGSLVLEEDWSDSLYGAIADGKILLGIHVIFNGKRREAEASLLTDGIEDVGCTRSAAACFGHEERIAVAMVALAPLHKVGRVEIGRIKIDRLTCGTPDIHDPWFWTAAGIAAGNAAFLAQPGVYVHRKIVRRFACGGDSLDEASIVPCHEGFVGVGIVTEYFGPCAGTLAAVFIPQLAKAGIERVVMRLEITCELGRNR